MSVRKELYRRNRCPAAASIAIVTMLAVLATPLCARICGASIGCESGAAIAEPSDHCHHRAVFDRTESERPALTSADVKLCSQRELPALISREQEPSWLVNSSPSATLFSQFQQTKDPDFNFLLRAAIWRHNVDPSLASPLAKSTLILRI
jgi:hypothetical protein